MDFSLPEELGEIRAAVRELCEGFPGEYWRELEPDRYPEEFVVLALPRWLADPRALDEVRPVGAVPGSRPRPERS